MKKISAATIRWSQDAQVKIPVTVLDKMVEIKFSYKHNGSDRNTLRARFDPDTGVLMMRGGPIAREQWLPVLTNENTWVRRIKEAGGLVEVVEVPPEVE